MECLQRFGICGFWFSSCVTDGTRRDTHGPRRLKASSLYQTRLIPTHKVGLRRNSGWLGSLLGGIDTCFSV